VVSAVEVLSFRDARHALKMRARGGQSRDALPAFKSSGMHGVRVKWLQVWQKAMKGRCVK